MTKYVQLRDSESFQEDAQFYADDPQRIRMVESVANALFGEWFPNYPEKGPSGEDFDNWHNIACSDAQVAVEALLKGAWIDDPTMD